MQRFLVNSVTTLKNVSAVIQYIIFEKHVRFTWKKFENINDIFFSNNYTDLS